MIAIKNMLIGGGLLAAFLLVQHMDLQDEIQMEAAIVENCNSMGKAAYRDPDTRKMRCALNASAWAFVNPMQKPE